MTLVECARDFEETQNCHNVSLSVDIDMSYAGVAEAWANGMSWSDVSCHSPRLNQISPLFPSSPLQKKKAGGLRVRVFLCFFLNHHLCQGIVVLHYRS